MDGRQREYERLIEPIADRMMRAVWRVSADPADAEDAFQEALLTVWKRWDRIVRHPNQQALILHICSNAALDVLRRRVRRDKRVEQGAASDFEGPSASPVQKLLGAEQRSQVFRAIGLLPQAQARAILMHAVEDAPYSDIATALGCREVTARKHVSRARSRLRGLLAHLLPAFQQEEASHVS